MQGVASAPTSGANLAEAWDPICGMAVDTQNARYTSELENKTFYFCCLRCKETFDGAPQL
jgi:YHS domain-containing protein